VLSSVGYAGMFCFTRQCFTRQGLNSKGSEDCMKFSASIVRLRTATRRERERYSVQILLALLSDGEILYEATS
jgi:hypothetical protein